MLAYRTTTCSASSYFHSLLRIYIPSRSLRSASERRLVVPSQRGSKSLSRTFSFTVPGWWNDLPTPIRNAGSLSKKIITLCRLNAIVINVLHFCFELHTLKMTSKIKHIIALFSSEWTHLNSFLSYRIRFIIYVTTLQAICTKCRSECVYAALNELFLWMRSSCNNVQKHSS